MAPIPLPPLPAQPLPPAVPPAASGRGRPRGDARAHGARRAAAPRPRPRARRPRPRPRQDKPLPAASRPPPRRRPRPRLARRRQRPRPPRPPEAPDAEPSALHPAAGQPAVHRLQPGLRLHAQPAALGPLGRRAGFRRAGAGVLGYPPAAQGRHRHRVLHGPADGRARRHAAGRERAGLHAAVLPGDHDPPPRAVVPAR